ncbi:MAG: GNAT family N-acetyltransferase [Acetobacteraceae bacterium]|nr:GNAT family N-acetyltransferase [Acetobacteraceae bacterium]
MNPAWQIRTARLVLSAVGAADLAEIQALKADPRVFAIMLGGVRPPARSADELAQDIRTWAARGYGMFAVRDRAGGGLLGLAGLMERPDGLGIALRFAFWPEARGRGLAREAAGAVLRFGHETVGLDRIVAVARESNFASRTVLGAIGMREVSGFLQEGHPMLLFESVRTSSASSAR